MQKRSKNSKEPALSIPQSLKQTLAESDLKQVGIDLTEVTLDSVLNEGVLRDIPIISTLTGVWKSGVTIRDNLFLRKLLLFLNESSTLPSKTRKQLLEKLQEESFQNEVGEKLISILDKLENGEKAQILGKAIVQFGNEEISKDEFWRISYIIEKLPLSDIYAIQDWHYTDLNNVDKVRQQLYLSVGIGWFVLDASSTGFCWQERLCDIISGLITNRTKKN